MKWNEISTFIFDNWDINYNWIGHTKVSVDSVGTMNFKKPLLNCIFQFYKSERACKFFLKNILPCLTKKIMGSYPWMPGHVQTQHYMLSDVFYSEWTKLSEWQIFLWPDLEVKSVALFYPKKEIFINGKIIQIFCSIRKKNCIHIRQFSEV